jgi:DNA-binding GntR family transcriptional regulator
VTISDFIQNDIRARALTPGGLPEPITLQALSGLYGVSLTPVRIAVNALVSDRVFRKTANGRVELEPSAAGVKFESIDIEGLSSPADIEQRLTNEIIRLGLGGCPVRLREEETAVRLGIGRTVLRQALHRLSGKGLIAHLPRRGWLVRLCDEADLASYLDVRETLELKALDLARPSLVARDLNRMLRGNRADPAGDRIDNEIHGYLVEKSGNRFIREFFERQGAYYTALLDYAAPEARVTLAMARQHRAILRALIAQDWHTARRALANHIRAQLPIVRDLLLSRDPHPEEQR